MLLFESSTMNMPWSSVAFFGSRSWARNLLHQVFELILDTLNLILCARQSIVESYYLLSVQVFDVMAWQLHPGIDWSTNPFP